MENALEPNTVVHQKGHLALNVHDIIHLGVTLARPCQLSILEHACAQFCASGCTVCT